VRGTGVYTLDLTRLSVKYYSWTETGMVLGIMSISSMDYLWSTVSTNKDYLLAIL
jgi:hypothetical protein